ncbi:MAG: UDP-N-acetylmuramate dehydrogenase [bacterium]|nr:UDP-N-acetylmuramate dehydrogenase [bacterium]
MANSFDNGLVAGVNGNVVRDAPMKDYTTFGVGGFAEFLITPQDENDIEVIFGAFDEVTVIGAGSNLLVSDMGIGGAVLRVSSTMDDIDVKDELFTAGAGCKLSALVAESARRSYAGLEWAVGIPGTIGGAVMMNAGAFGSAVWQFIDHIRVVSKDGGIDELTASDVTFSYRQVDLKTPVPFAVTAVQFKLRPGDKSEIKALIKDISERRHRKQPLDVPSAGSVFKNPRPDVSAGRLIERAGLKGARCGGAAVSSKHANFVVNEGGATADDIYSLIRYAKKTVKEEYDFDLQPEIVMLGEFEYKEGSIETLE